MRNRLLRFVVFALALMQTFFADAQRPFATLEHEGTMTAYYGVNAMVEAIAVASHGDIITLSPGQFNTPNPNSTYVISKAVTIRGAGMIADTANRVERTIINGYINLDIPFETAQCLSLEGLYFNSSISYTRLKQPLFKKCYIPQIYYSGNSAVMTSSRMRNATFINCIIAVFRNQARNLGDTLLVWTNTGTQFINCVVSYGNNAIGQTYSSETLVNCIIQLPAAGCNSKTIRNSIIYGNSYDGAVGSSCEYCIGIAFSASYNYFNSELYPTRHLYNYSSMSNVFQSFDWNNATIYNGTGVNYHMRDNVANSRLGDDGTEIGIYGGTHPFDPRVVRHTVTVPSTPNEQGILNIQINTISE